MQIKPITATIVLSLVVASLLVSGCTTSNQANQASSSETSTNASTTISATTTAATTTAATTTAATTTAATTSPTVTPSPSASPTATPSPSVSGTIATSIQFARVPTVVKGGDLYVNVISSSSGCRICSLGAVTVSGAGGQTIGTVSSGGSDCFYTAYLDTSSLNPGTYDVILKFAGDSYYESSQSTSTITIL
jgi:outer membrane murein-binding lipoprotein Lpp